ncbi:hypothetical protein BDV30DRAFT_181436 [Aspergillus minisclerotigenes]|uniref:Secreted protein n=1 Tax=Aspergillus minisclerotigenes TaxID=656917 RepID=A0A5N6JII3_9EURO|nr:hypothetical protein BDV30DRAFT_181436 [Aspergillus minisclerotigenes]
MVTMTRHSFGIAVVAATLPSGWCATRTAQQPVRTKGGRTSMNNLDSLRATRLTRLGITGKVTTFLTLRLARPWGLTEALITSGERRPAQE